ncbi:MAG: hypothetical protein H7301_08260 [Cryobacterium sp.]|nr:hypothetical protein [Oligoflexia bacterium]
MMESFETWVPGKWVLAGEHTVLRGGRAIAIPHADYGLVLRFSPGESPLEITPSEAKVVILELIVIAREWFTQHGAGLSVPPGVLSIESNIPLSGGFGSSAALSVALARWFLSFTKISDLPDSHTSLECGLAKEMENRFHGRSSGMDVAVVSLGVPILFTMNGGAVSLGLEHLPRFFFFDTGIRSATKDSIEKVNAYRISNPDAANALDAEMSLAVDEALEGLERYNASYQSQDSEGQSRALSFIAQSMRRSHFVFLTWGLVPEETLSHFARSPHERFAARLTGAGDGGFIVKLVHEGSEK